MDRYQKIALLSENMDAEEGESPQTCELLETKKQTMNPLVTYARLPGGGNIPLLKTMITSVCERNCNYCAFRSGRDFRRASFKPEEMADTFQEFYQKNIAKGLFLSSGIAGGGIHIQDKIIQTAEILRIKNKFQGYMHLKIMPGAEYDQIKALMMYADRVSINLEAPNPDRLKDLAPKKNFLDELFTRLKWVDEIRRREEPVNVWKNRWPSVSTQFVVGPSGESDLEILKTSEYLFKRLNLARVYFMTFNPVKDTPFENTESENPIRGHRLYQASFLIRDYGFSLEDLAFLNTGRLSLTEDPKTAWAETHFLDYPVELNTADRETLLRIPGIGPKRVKMILKYRRIKTIRDADQLISLGIPVEKVNRFILLDGSRPAYQLRLL
ncbi:MAG: hypothetical protein CVU39_20525 [Chloroflexi bacterium HGW-Chloroflexi-10]|nr:MAG: hypothetical protein CVU39_20525 [Chloroflexi bacterium HGW-Chloroflexi-10]